MPYIESKENKIYEEAFEVSKKLIQDFRFARIDWMIYNSKLYFAEITFTPFSGFLPEDICNSDFYKEINEKFRI